MPGINLTGVSETSDYNLGRGKVFFAANDPLTGIPGGFRDLGNCPEFSISQETETLEHQSSLQGLKVTDLELVLSQKINVNMSLDELNFQNLALFLSGTAEEITNPGATVVTDETVPGPIMPATWYTLHDASGQRIYDVEAISVTGASETTDYITDLKFGRIFIVPSGALDDAADFEFSTTVSGTIANIDTVDALATISVSGSLQFIAENPAAGDHLTEYLFMKISLKPEGDFSLIGDEISTLTLSGIAEKNDQMVGSPTMTVRTFLTAVA